MTDHRMVGSVRTCPFLGKFPLAQSVPLKASGHSRALSSDWTVPTSVVVVVFVPQRSDALVHVAEATSIVADRRLPLSVYIRRKKYTLSLTSVCHLLALTDNNNRGSSVTHSQLTYVPLGVRARRVTNLPCGATGRGCCPFYTDNAFCNHLSDFPFRAPALAVQRGQRIAP